MKQKGTAKSEETRQRILEAALELFRERGFAETTMRDIAASAGMATGAAYYYFPSKEALVHAFYVQSQSEMEQVTRRPLAGSRDLKERLRAIIELKFEQFLPYRPMLGALFRTAADPASPMSPFGDETKEIREAAVALFREAVEGSDAKIHRDLEPHLPRLLWMYQMGLILFWIHDRSPDQAKTKRLVDRSLDIVVLAIRLARYRALAPLRQSVLALLEDLSLVDGTASAGERAR